MIYDDKGYVIRCVELQGTGHVYYRGMKDAYANEKDAIPFGRQHFKIAKLALMPFGATID